MNAELRIAEHFMRQVENNVRHIQANRNGANDSAILDQVQSSLTRLAGEFNRLKKLDAQTYKEAKRYGGI